MNEADPVAWATYFASDDSDATAAGIAQAGGRVVVPPMDVAPFGRMTVALDPQGNAFGLWEAREHTGFQRYNEPGSVTWNEASVDDAAGLRPFYAQVFGWTYDEVPGGQGYTTFRTTERTPDYPQGGLGDAAAPDAPRGWLVCFSVPSADETVAAVGSAGGAVLLPPMDTPFGRFAVVRDPWGAAFEVMQASARD